MTSAQIVYIGDAWDRMVGSDRHEEIKSWLRANGIEPNDMPIDRTVTVETGPGGERTIRHVVYIRNAGGHRYLADPDDVDAGAATEERVMPLVVEPPMQWYIGKENTDARE